MDTNHIIANLSPSTKMSMYKVKRFLNAGKASVMVGCGFSLNAEDDGTGQMRDWNSLNVDLFKSLYSRAPLAEEMAGLSPIRLASQVKAVHGEHELNEIIMNALPDKSVFPGSLHKKLMKLPWRDVFTTNYDTLLERSCDESGCAYTLVSTKDTLIYSKSPRIIKLHGSFPDKRPFIITEEQFRTYPAKYPEFVNTVRQSLIENLFCLIGFSGNDPNFLSWLGWVRDVMGRQMTNAILIDYKPDGIHISERQLFSDRKIDELVRMFECINFERIDSKQREELTSLLSECVQAKSPCLYALTIIGAASLSQSVTRIGHRAPRNRGMGTRIQQP